ncbi:hypothetical protein Sjap_022710 [Stephania japonica]|uniref:Uncharacterized protein n=1 Tax=Stephania japonica TaxID=461633 RepID=A0AAP0HQ44_9MAGN
MFIYPDEILLQQGSRTMDGRNEPIEQSFFVFTHISTHLTAMKPNVTRHLTCVMRGVAQ